MYGEFPQLEDQINKQDEFKKSRFNEAKTAVDMLIQ
jgi:hypothetical protein